MNWKRINNKKKKICIIPNRIKMFKNNSLVILDGKNYFNKAL